MITELTAEQDQQLDAFAESGILLSLSTDPIDRLSMKDAADWLLKMCEADTEGTDVKLIYASGPDEAWQHLKREAGIEGDVEFFEPGFRGNLQARLPVWGESQEKVLGIDISGTGSPEFLEFTKKFHFIFLLDTAVVFCERPIRDFRVGIQSERINGRGVITGDVNTNLFDRHCEDGPALEYADGTKLWYIDGICVDEQIVMRPHEQSLADIQADTDNDRRRLRIKRYGWARYLRDCGAEVLDDRPGEALFTVQGEDYNIFVCVDKASPDLVSLPLPKSVTDCASAQLWLQDGNDWKIIATA